MSIKEIASEVISFGSNDADAVVIISERAVALAVGIAVVGAKFGACVGGITFAVGIAVIGAFCRACVGRITFAIDIAVIGAFCRACVGRIAFAGSIAVVGAFYGALVTFNGVNFFVTTVGT